MNPLSRAESLKRQSSARPAPGRDSTDESSGFAPGLLLNGKYRLIRRVDEGAMGEIWEGYHRELDTSVAIKLVRGGGRTPELRARLGTEARALAQLEHPAILRVLDFSHSEDGDPYLVTELLEGECLDLFILKNGSLAPSAAVQLLLPIVDGLAIAHERNIVHRDLKPANVFLAQGPGRRLQPKLLDFGIALVNQPVNLKITADGAVLGSPEYMSPEQARGESRIDARTDVWALCVLLYEAISGSTPFDGEDYPEVLQNIVEQPAVRPDELDGPNVGLWDIIERGLRKPRQERWQSMPELGRALAEWLLARGVTEDSTGTSLRGMWLQLPTDLRISSFPPVALASTISLPGPGVSSPSLSSADTSLSASEAFERNPRLSTGGAGAIEVEPKARRPWTRRAKQGTLAAGLMLLGVVLLALGTTSGENRAAVESAANVEIGATPPLPRAKVFVNRAAHAYGSAVTALPRPTREPAKAEASTVSDREAKASDHRSRKRKRPHAASQKPPGKTPSVSTPSVPPSPPRRPEPTNTSASVEELKDPYQ